MKKFWGFSVFIALGLSAFSSEGIQMLWDISHGCLLRCISNEDTDLLTILEEEGVSVVMSDKGVLNEDLSQFDGLIITAGSSHDSSYNEAEASVIEDFTINGGGLLIMDDPCVFFPGHINPVAQRFGVLSDQLNTLFPDILHPIIEHPIFDGVERIVMGCAYPLIVESPSLSAAENTDGEVGVAIAEVGQGRVVVTGDETLFKNSCLREIVCDPNDNERFARNLFRWLFACKPVEPPLVRSQGYWRMQCKEDDTPDAICSLLDQVKEISDHFDSFDCSAVCDLMSVDPPENDMCRKAERQFMALLLNLASGKITSCNCMLDGRTVEEVVSEIELLLSGNPDHATCVHAMSLAEEINTGESLVDCNSHVVERKEDRDQVFLSSLPNPFVSSTVIQYEISKNEENTLSGSSNKNSVQLKIYDLTGRLVRRLVDGIQEVGSYSVHWNGKDEKGEEVPNGVYFYRLQRGDFTITKKLIFMR